MLNKNIENSWKQHIEGEFQKDYFLQLENFLIQRSKTEVPVYPESKNIFKALDSTPFEEVKVVILGQDPYHGPGQAHGLSFSVPRGQKIPPSLQNIFKELHEDLRVPISSSGDLCQWAQQGVLLLNSVLTVEDGKPGSHQNQGWEKFTDRVVEVLNEKRQNLVFILWGAYSQKKGVFINTDKHLIIKSAHPSPLSSYRGFFGSRPFSKTNEYLISTQQSPINWSLS